MSLFSTVKNKVSILDVIGEYTTLKKAGSYWKGSCPFHHEKTASFTVSPHKEIFYCFGCHAGGDVIAFISRIEHCSQFDAAKHLIERYSLDIPLTGHESKETTDQENQEKNRYFELCKAVATWCHEALLKNSNAYHYLMNRKVSRQSIDDFTLGYFPGGLASIKMLLHAMNEKGYLADDLIKAHILMSGKTVLYSPFEERIIFPIRDHLGRYCGFGGRIFQPNDDRPKYYNSKENKFFYKGTLLFGLDRAKKAIQNNEGVILVEGYTDCIAVAQHGFANVVATLGTACTVEHLKSLAQHAQHLYVLYDGDQAGQQAMIRLTELCWHVNMELKVVTFSVQEDPASFINNGGNLGELLQQAKDIFDFFIESSSKGFASKSLNEKLTVARKLVEVIQRLDDPLKRGLLLQKASKAFEIPLDAINSVNTADYRSDRNTPVVPPENNSQSEIPKLEKKLFCAILNNTHLIEKNEISTLVEYFSPLLRTILYKLLSFKKDKDLVDFSSFFGSLERDEQNLISSLLLEGEEDTTNQTFEYLVGEFHKKQWKILVTDMKQQLEVAKREENQEKVKEILDNFSELKRKILSRGLP